MFSHGVGLPLRRFRTAGWGSRLFRVSRDSVRSGGMSTADFCPVQLFALLVIWFECILFIDRRLVLLCIVIVVSFAGFLSYNDRPRNTNFHSSNELWRNANYSVGHRPARSMPWLAFRGKFLCSSCWQAVVSGRCSCLKLRLVQRERFYNSLACISFSVCREVLVASRFRRLLSVRRGFALPLGRWH